LLFVTARGLLANAVSCVLEGKRRYVLLIAALLEFVPGYGNKQ
jgi:hypothetical protein